MSESEDEDKQHEPSQKKLDDARKKGEIPRSADLHTAAAYGGFLVTAYTLGGLGVLSLGDTLSILFQDAVPLAEELFSGHIQPVSGGVLASVVMSVAIWFFIPALSVVASVIVQKSFVVAPEKIKPKLSRISMLANAKNKFGRSGLFEFAKSLSKLIIYSTVLGMFLLAKTPQIIGTINLESPQIAMLFAQLALEFMFIVLIVAVAIGVVDFIWQSAEHTRKNRMSRKEVTDEAKQSEGDPHMKQQRRQRAYEIAMNQMLADVPSADVIVVNPSHFAVALKWSRDAGAAPVCVAKGVDEVAAKIREIANESGVPIHRDPPTARALFAAVAIGNEIWPEHYQAVAAAIRFAEAMTTKAKGKGWQN